MNLNRRFTYNKNKYMHRRKFLSAIFIMPFVAKAIAENGAAGEEGSPISLRDIEWEAHKNIAKEGFEGFGRRTYWEAAGPMPKGGPFWDENGNPIYMKDEYMMPHGEDLNLSGLEGAQDKNFIEHEVHPFGKVKFRADEIPDDWIPSRIEMNGHILERIYEYPKEKEVPKPLVTWQLFRKDGTIVTLK